MALTDAKFAEVVLPHLSEAHRLARWLTGNDHDAEDIVQEASLRALRYLETFSGGNSRAWFLRIVRNTCYAQGHRHRPADEFDEDRHSDTQVALDPEALLLRSASTVLIDQVMKGLPARYRELLELREIEGLSYQELADVLAVPIGTVMSGLSRARQALRRAVHAELNQRDQEREAMLV
jgi:RNA polymerase sigma-70 factor (ECF subfamily)